MGSLYILLAIFVMQILANFATKYLSARLEESGKLKALGTKEHRDLVRKEQVEIGNQILDFILEPYEFLKSEDVRKMKKSSSRLESLNPQLASSWIEYYFSLTLQALDTKSGMTARNNTSYWENVKRGQKLREYLEREANALIGELR